MSKILVTGSAGFMSSHLVDHLIDKGYQVLGIDNLEGGILENVSEKAKQTFFKIDLLDHKKTANFIKEHRPQIIFHLAASAHEGLSQFTPIHNTQNNLIAYLNLLVPAIKSGLKRIVLASSMAVYGKQKPPFTENMPRVPSDIYGIAKAAMEQVTEVLSDVFNFEYVILRPHNVYGPRQNMADPYRNVVAIFINSLLRGKSFYIYGSGNQKRSFTYIGDIVKPLASAGFKKNVNGQIINLGPEKEYTINHLARLVLNTFDSNLKPKYLPERPREVKEAYCSSEKAKSLLRFKDTTSLEKGIKLMIQWAKTTGYKKPKYLESLELENDSVPLTWRKKLI